MGQQEGASSELRRRLALFQKKSFRKDQLMLQNGEANDNLIIIQRGEARLCIRKEGSKEKEKQRHAGSRSDRTTVGVDGAAGHASRRSALQSRKRCNGAARRKYGQSCVGSTARSRLYAANGAQLNAIAAHARRAALAFPRPSAWARAAD